MFKAGWLKLLPGYLMCVLAFFIPFPFIYSSVTIIVLFAVWLLQFNWHELRTNLRQRPWLILWLFFFVLHGISYFYSDNKDQSLSDLQVKLSFIIFPIVIGTYQFTPKLLHRIFAFFVLGVTAMAVFCLVRGGLIWKDTHFTPIFFYHNLVNDLDVNAVYMSWYALLAITIILLFRRSFLSKLSVFFAFLILPIILLFFILLSSRMLIAVFFAIVGPIYIFKQIRRTKYATRNFIIVGMFFLALVLTIFKTQNPIKNRYNDLINNDLQRAWLNDYSSVADSPLDNMTLRVFIWRIGFENIREHNLWFYGAGNGDVRGLQNDKMVQYKMPNMNTDDPEKKSEYKDINMHNMYMQSLMMIGLPGLCIFILISLLPFLYFGKIFHYNYIYIVFHITSLLFFMQEAALQTQAGVVFYTFFWNVFYAVKKRLTI